MCNDDTTEFVIAQNYLMKHSYIFDDTLSLILNINKNTT